MKQLVEEKSVKERAKSANEIASEVLALTKQKRAGGLFQALSRRAEFADWAARIESFPMAFTAPDDERLFLQFNLTVNIGGQLHRIIGWVTQISSSNWKQEKYLVFSMGLFGFPHRVQAVVNFHA